MAIDDPTTFVNDTTGSFLTGEIDLLGANQQNLLTYQAPTALTFCAAGKAIITVDCHSDPPSVWIDPDLAWDTAAKHFWNAVHRIAGRPAPFADID